MDTGEQTRRLARQRARRAESAAFPPVQQGGNGWDATNGGFSGKYYYFESGVSPSPARGQIGHLTGASSIVVNIYDYFGVDHSVDLAALEVGDQVEIGAQRRTVRDVVTVLGELATIPISIWLDMPDAWTYLNVYKYAGPPSDFSPDFNNDFGV